MPDDASLIVIAGPKTDFFPTEIDALKKYLDKAGKLLMMVDPPDKPDAPPEPNLIALAHDWGVDLGNDIVVDASGMGRLIGTDASVPVAATYPSHPITKSGRSTCSRRIRWPVRRRRSAGGVNGHTAQPFVETSPRSWAEADIKGAHGERRGFARRIEGRQERADHDRSRRVCRVDAARDRREAGNHATPPSPRRG